jgi:hypothetical protein
VIGRRLHRCCLTNISQERQPPLRRRLHQRRYNMKRLFLLAAIAAVIPWGAGVAAAAELPAYESMGLPISALQISVVGSSHVQEVSPAPTLTAAGMPATPHQVAVLTARKGVLAKFAGKPLAGDGGVTR